jgi:hypothetical protein
MQPVLPASREIDAAAFPAGNIAQDLAAKVLARENYSKDVLKETGAPGDDPKTGANESPLKRQEHIRTYLYPVLSALSGMNPSAFLRFATVLPL